jgi:hypothetical protein
MLTVRRRRKALLLPAPAPLDISRECRRAGIDEPALLAARELRIAVVHTEAGGALRIVEG